MTAQKLHKKKRSARPVAILFVHKQRVREDKAAMLSLASKIIFLASEQRALPPLQKHYAQHRLLIGALKVHYYFFLVSDFLRTVVSTHRTSVLWSQNVYVICEMSAGWQVCE